MIKLQTLISSLQFPEKTAHFPSVASGANWVYLQQQGVAIAIDADFLNALDVAGGAALVPQFLAAAAPKVGLVRFQGKLQCLLVHPGNHEDFVAEVVLENGRNQPFLIKF